jgi:transcription initiation factor TFIIIB Brf1 subunit/transcription initiation factor TFIIB
MDSRTTAQKIRHRKQSASFKPENCQNCKKTAVDLSKEDQLRVCKRCGIVQYCSRICAGADWPRHKEGCVRQARKQNQNESKKLKAGKKTHSAWRSDPQLGVPVAAVSRWARGPSAPGAVGFACRSVRSATLTKAATTVATTVASIAVGTPASETIPVESAPTTMTDTPAARTQFRSVPHSVFRPTTVDVGVQVDVVDVGVQTESPPDVVPEYVNPQSSFRTENETTVSRAKNTEKSKCWEEQFLELHKKFRAVLRRAANGSPVHVHDLKLCLDLFELETRDQPNHGLQTTLVESARKLQTGGKQMLSRGCVLELQSWQLVFGKDRTGKRKAIKRRQATYPQPPNQVATIPYSNSLFASPTLLWDSYVTQMQFTNEHLTQMQFDMAQRRYEAPLQFDIPQQLERMSPMQNIWGHYGAQYAHPIATSPVCA